MTGEGVILEIEKTPSLVPQISSKIKRPLVGVPHDFYLHSFSMDTVSITCFCMGIYPVYHRSIFKSSSHW